MPDDSVDIIGPSSSFYVSQRLRLHYVDWGNETAPPLLLIHGGRDHARSWDWVARDLRRDFHVLVPDLPGFGASEPPAQLGFSIREQSLRLEAWLAQVGVGECLLAGNSMGAWIAGDFAARHPGRVTALWLQSPFGVLSAQPSEVLSGLERGEVVSTGETTSSSSSGEPSTDTTQQMMPGMGRMLGG